MKYYLIAGEASGDLQASFLIKELGLCDSDSDFRCFGGDLMEQEGAKIVKHYKELAFMGITAVIMNIRTILKNLSFCKEDILKYKPDVLILVDYPGFNMKISKWAKAKNIKVYYYISPKIWAWNQKRVHKIKKYIDKMFVILPFEEEFYAKFNYPVEFVGHPLLDSIANRPKASFEEFCKNHQLNTKPIIALLPGSRKQEISAVLSVMLTVVEKFPNFQFVIAGAPSQNLNFYKQFITKNIKIIENKTYDLLQHSSSALVVSGTATLETALFKVPQVVCYKTSLLTYNIGKLLIKVKYISLVNLVMNREVVKELIQKDLTTTSLTKELNRITTGESRNLMLKNYEKLQQELGGIGASKRAAQKMFSSLKS